MGCWERTFQRCHRRLFGIEFCEDEAFAPAGAISFFCESSHGGVGCCLLAVG
jgi:hypothetical protein